MRSSLNTDLISGYAKIDKPNNSERLKEKTFQFYTVKSVDEVEKKEKGIKASKKKKQNNTGENLGKDMLEKVTFLIFKMLLEAHQTKTGEKTGRGSQQRCS